MDQKILGVYALKHRDEKIRMKSRSGGAFTAISDAVLKKNGIVYGCKLTDKFEARHVRADNVTIRNQMRGSKYIPSRLDGTFINVKNDLEEDRLVLFTGTSCQVAGLKSFLGKEYKKLIYLDILCHGVPSPIIWKKYIEWLEKIKESRVVGIDFRNKEDFGWKAHVESIYFENNDVVNSSLFKELFLSNLILRPSCYKCRYKSIYHQSDITIGDYWGIDKAVSGFNDDKGMSLVIINSQKGKKIFDEAVSDCIVKETKIEDAMQKVLVSPYECPGYRDIFWDDFKKNGLEFAVKNFLKFDIDSMIRNDS